MKKSKIEMSLSDTELQEFLKVLSDTKNLTLKRLQELAGEKGIEVSLMSAKTFRDGAFTAHLERLRKARELARQVAEFGSTDSVGSLADAGASVLMQEVFDQMTSGEEIDLESFSKIIARLRTGDHRLKELNAKLALQAKQIAELERQKQESIDQQKQALKTLKADKSIKAETLENVEQQLKLL